MLEIPCTGVVTVKLSIGSLPFCEMRRATLSMKPDWDSAHHIDIICGDDSYRLCKSSWGILEGESTWRSGQMAI